MDEDLTQYFMISYVLPTTYNIHTEVCELDMACLLCSDSLKSNKVIPLPCGCMFHDNCFLVTCVEKQLVKCPVCYKEIKVPDTSSQNISPVLPPYSEPFWISPSLGNKDLPLQVEPNRSLPQNETDLPYYI